MVYKVICTASMHAYRPFLHNKELLVILYEAKRTLHTQTRPCDALMSPGMHHPTHSAKQQRNVASLNMRSNDADMDTIHATTQHNAVKRREKRALIVEWSILLLGAS